MRTEVITAAALVARINRKLRPHAIVKKTRGKYQVRDLGPYHMLDCQTGAVQRMSLRDLEDAARELGVLADYEVLEAA